MRPATLAVAFAGLLSAPGLAQDYSWTPCHRLETGGKLYELCRACEGQGSGMRFYVSRNGAQTQCQRDPQTNSGLYRKPWEDDDKAVRQSTSRPVPSALVPAPAPPSPEKKSYAPSTPSATKAPSTAAAASSSAKAAAAQSTRPVRDVQPPRPPASHATATPRQSTEPKPVSSPPRARTEAENRREAEHRRELKKAEP